MRISDWSSDVCSSDLLRAVGADFDGNLIGRTADAAAAHFDVRTDVGERFVEHADRFLLGAGLDRFESAIDDAFGDGLLAVEHDAVHALGQPDIPETGIGQDFAAFGATTTRPGYFLLNTTPPPGRLLTSSFGWMLASASWNTPIGSFLARASTASRAP